MGTDRELPVIGITGLNKRFDGFHALTDINLAIPRGRIVGLVGANGSGKSTLLRHITGIYLPTEGECLTFGIPADRLDNATLARMGYVHQEGKLVGWMSVGEMLNFVSDHYEYWNHDLIERLLKRSGLNKQDIVNTLSPGQRQQLAILLAIGHEPELLILDEPAAGLDPIARNDFLQMLLEIIQDPKRTILISSHILTDIEKVIDHVLILDEGRIIRDCAFDDLLEEFVKLRLTSLNGELPRELPFADMLSCERNDSQALLIVKNTGEDFNARAAAANCSLQPLPLTFEEIYALLVKKPAIGREASQ